MINIFTADYSLNIKNELMIRKIINSKKSYLDGTGNNFAYWALFLDEETRTREIDTCATCGCLSILTQYNKLSSNLKSDNIDYKELDNIIGSALRTVVHLRKTDGSWPSVVAAPSDANGGVLAFSENREVALTDNYSALTALLDVGFLDDGDFRYVDFVPENLKKLSARIDYVIESFNWLLAHMAVENTISSPGWFYTDASINPEKEAKTLPTSNVAIVLCRIRDAIKTCSLSTQYIDICESINSVIKNINRKLIIGSNNGTNGIGTSLSGEGEDKLSCTCKMIDALMFSGEFNDYTGTIFGGLSSISNMILKNESILNDIIEEYDIYEKDSLGPLRVATVKHENFIYGMVLFTLMNFLRIYYNGKVVQYQSSGEYPLITKINKAIQDIGEKLNGLRDWEGLFKSPIKDNPSHPVYATYESFRIICLYQELVRLNFGIHSNEGQDMRPLNNDEQDLFEDIAVLIEQLENYKNCNKTKDREGSVNQVEKYIKHLEQLQEEIQQQSRALNEIRGAYVGMCTLTKSYVA